MTLFRNFLSVLLTFFAFSTQGFSSGTAQEQQSIGLNWSFLGDSQTAGRAKSENTKSHAVAFKRIWVGTFDSEISPAINGVSGRTMNQTREYYLGNASQDSSWIHFQESGNQLSDNGSQDTPEKFSVHFEGLVRAIAEYSPNAIISTETAYSFEAERIKGRNWRRYNAALHKSVLKLKSEGITVYIANVDNNIKKLVAAKKKQLGKKAGQQAVWGGHNNEIKRHYTGLGNLMVALSIYYALAYNLDTLDFKLIPNEEVSQEDIALCREIIEMN